MAMVERNPSGIKTYYRTLADGTDAPCGVRLELSRVPRETVTEIILSECDKPGTRITLFANDNPKSYECVYKDLESSPNDREQFLQTLAKIAVDWCDAIVILHSASLVDDNKPPALNSGKYSLEIGEDSITETFMTQQLSEEELERLLERLAKDRGPKIITVQNDWGNTTVGDIDPAMDDEIIEAARRSDWITIDHHIFSKREHLNDA